MTIFLDTDVLIDCLRGLPTARSWLSSAATEEFLIPGVVAMELIMGCQNKADLHRVEKFLDTFSIAWPAAADFASAHSLLRQYRFASGLSIPDCLIAAHAMSHPATLYTFNIKHFRAIEGLDVQQPYQRI